MTENKLVADKLVGRRDFRSELIRIAQDYSREVTDMIPPRSTFDNIIATGHQPVWHHCGIWVKNLTACRFAEAAGGHCLHLILDHDVCDTSMILPRPDRCNHWCSERYEIETEKREIPLEYRRLPNESRLRAFIDIVTKTRSGQFCDKVWSQSTLLDAKRISCCNSIADIITRLQSALEVALGLGITYLPVSKLSESDAFLAFVTSIVMNSAAFASAYNDAANKIIETEAIQRRCIRLSKLDESTGMIQLPFWLNMPDGERTTLCVVSCLSGKIKIGNPASTLGELDSASEEGKADQFRTLLKRSGYSLRPKAVSLTLFVRLYLADWFVHGVGGSLYEPVTDYLIENYYGIQPLSFGTATCTMTLPLSNNPVLSGNDLSQLKHTLHDIEHNPEKYVDESVLRQEDVLSLLQAKTETIALAGDRSVPASARKSAWNSLRRINKSLSEYTSKTAKMTEKKIAECEKSKASQEVCNCREYFFGLFPEDRLRKLTESLTFGEPQ